MTYRTTEEMVFKFQSLKGQSKTKFDMMFAITVMS